MMEGKSLFNSWHRQCYFSFLVHPDILLGTESHVKSLIKALYPDVQWANFETDYSLPMRRICVQLPGISYKFVHRDHLTLTSKKLF
jgi:hypothetical protein